MKRYITRLIASASKRVQLRSIIILSVLFSFSSCYSVMPISNASTETVDKADGKTVIVYYDSSIGTDAIEKFIKTNDIEVLTATATSMAMR